jgi:hypothetical protein
MEKTEPVKQPSTPPGKTTNTDGFFPSPPTSGTIPFNCAFLWPAKKALFLS